MPWYDGNIPANFKTALERKTGAKFAVEVVLDPDGAAIALDGDHDIVDMAEVTQERDLDIDAGGMAYIPDVTLTFNDLDNYFDPDNTASPFHQCEATLSEDASAGATVLKLLSWPEVAFADTESLIISDATNSETVNVGGFTADTGSEGYHTLLIDAPGLVHDYAAGSRIYTAPIAGKQILVRLSNLTEATTEKLTLFRGEIIKNPEISCGQARITCADARKRALDSTLVGADADATYKLMCVGTDGSLRSSIVWPNEFNVPPLTYVISDGALPAGLIMDSDTGAISGTPTTAGNYSFTIKVTNADGESITQACTMVVYARINEDFDSALGLGDYTKEGEGNGATFSLSAGGEGKLRMAFAQSGGYYSTWDNVNGWDETSTPPCALSITSPGALTGNWVMITRIDAANFPTHTNDAMIGLFVRDNTTDGFYGFSLGFNLSKSQVAGYDVQAANRYGPAAVASSNVEFRMRKVSNVYYFDYRLTGATSWTNLGNKSASFTPGHIGLCYHQYGGSPQSLTGSADVDFLRFYSGSLAVASTALPYTRAGDVYDFTLRASGGAGEYAWDVSSGSLPAGLSLNASTGAITGTVTADGTTNFTVRVTDGAGSTATQAVSIVASANNEIVPDIWCWGEDNVAYSKTLRLYIGGGLDRDQVTIGSRCPLGKWSFKWTTATAFECTPPGMAMVTGDIGSEFSIESIITIPAAAWSAGMAADDEMTFITGVTWINANPVQAIYDLLTDKISMLPRQIDASSYFGAIVTGTLYAAAAAGESTIKVSVDSYFNCPACAINLNDGVHSEDIIGIVATVEGVWPPYIEYLVMGTLSYNFGLDAVVTITQTSDLSPNYNSFDAEYEYCRDEDILISLTLDRTMTPAQAVEAVGQHAGIIQYHSFGLECLHAMRPRLISAIHEFTAADIKADVATETLEMVNVITVQYAYDYINQKYLGSYTYPPSATANPSYRRYGKEIAKTIYCPGIYNDEQAQLAAQRKYEQFAAGMQLVTVNCDFMALIMRIGERWDLDIVDPDIDGRFETIKKSISVMAPRNVALTGYNAAVYDKFALPDAALADVHCAW